MPTFNTELPLAIGWTILESYPPRTLNVVAFPSIGIEKFMCMILSW